MLRMVGCSTAPSPHEKWGEGNSPPPLNVIPLESGIHAVSALPPKADIL